MGFSWSKLVFTSIYVHPPSTAARSGFGWGGSPRKLENFCWCG